MRGKILTQTEIKKSLPKREKDSFKNDFGQVLVIAGSPGLTGAACLTSVACLRVGAGLVTLGIPKSLNPIVATKLTEVMTKPLSETEEHTLSLKALDEINSYILVRKVKVLAVGPGLSTHRETVELVRGIISTSALSIVLDADGINALVGEVELLKKSKAKIVLTPHPGELARLVRIKASQIQEERIKYAQEFAQEYQVIVALKGYKTVVTNGEKVFINANGNPGMATAGCGDVLTGMIAGLIAQGMDLFEAAKVGVFLHGLAGDLAVKEKTEMGLIAGDILDKIPLALKKIKR